jgi:hypothetical protein
MNRSRLCRSCHNWPPTWLSCFGAGPKGHGSRHDTLVVWWLLVAARRCSRRNPVCLHNALGRQRTMVGIGRPIRSRCWRGSMARCSFAPEDVCMGNSLLGNRGRCLRLFGGWSHRVRWQSLVIYRVHCLGARFRYYCWPFFRKSHYPGIRLLLGSGGSLLQSAIRLAGRSVCCWANMCPVAIWQCYSDGSARRC